MNENKFLKIKKCENHEYFYAERLGVDSVAFILHDRNTGYFGLIKEFKPPIGKLLITAFGGSIDKHIDLSEIVREEVREEAGFTSPLAIIPLGKCFVSTQMNQFCHLFRVDVTYAEKVDKEPQNIIEAMSSVVWLTESEILNTHCWKAITILTRSGL